MAVRARKTSLARRATTTTTLSSGTCTLGSESFLSAAVFRITEVGVKARRGEEELPP